MFGDFNQEALMVNGQILRRCCEDIKHLGEEFGRYDTDNVAGLNKEEFRAGMRKLEIEDCSDAMIDECFQQMDANGNGVVALTEFFDMLLGCSLGSGKRLEVVNAAWEHLDKNKDKKIAIHEMARYYDVKSHPYVTTGCMTEPEAALDIFCEEFKKRREDDDQSVTKQEFIDYHAGISAKVEDCDAYVKYVRLIWKMDEDESDNPPKYQDAKFSASKGCSLGSGKRLEAVNKAWNGLSDNVVEKISFQEVKERYNVKVHPYVTTGCMDTKGAALDIFCMQFNKRKDAEDQSITKQEFIDYYERLSLKVQDDDAFVKYVSSIWKKKENSSDKKTH